MVVMEGRRRREGTERFPLAGKRLLGPVVSSAPPYNSRTEMTLCIRGLGIKTRVGKERVKNKKGC